MRFTNLIIAMVLVLMLASMSKAGVYAPPFPEGSMVMNLDETYYMCYQKASNLQAKMDCLQNARERYSKDIQFYMDATKHYATGEGDLGMYIKYADLLAKAREAGLATMRSNPMTTDYRLLAVDAVNMYSIRNMFDTMSLMFRND